MEDFELLQLITDSGSAEMLWDEDNYPVDGMETFFSQNHIKKQLFWSGYPLVNQHNELENHHVQLGKSIRT